MWDTELPCDYHVTREDTTALTCSQLSLRWNIPTASLQALNDISCASVSGTSFCAPDVCGIAVVPKLTDVRAFLESYDNITMTQFVEWNPFANLLALQEGDTVCVS